MRQWDIVKVRINPEDRDEHPAVVLSRDEVCVEPASKIVNVLYGSKLRPAQFSRPDEVVLNGADGLEFRTRFLCGHLYTVQKVRVSGVIGRVTPERRRQIGRRIVETFRLSL